MVPFNDHESALPVRSETDAHEKVHVKLVDKDNPETQQMIVDTDGNAHAETHGDNPAGDDVVLQLSEEGRSNERGDYDVATNSKPASVGLVAHERNAAKTEAHQTMRVSAVNSSVDADVTAQDMALRDESGNPYTQDNPLPVSMEESEGLEIHDAHIPAVAIAPAADDIHEYTVPASKVLLLEQVTGAASGRARLTIEYGNSAAPTVLTPVYNSTANPMMDYLMRRTVKVVAGDVVRVTKRNRDKKAIDISTTIIGLLKDA